MIILYQDNRVLCCIKPAGVSYEMMPELIREELGDSNACIRQVHRLDTVTAGVMLFARSRQAERILKKDIADRVTHKEYIAIAHGTPDPLCGRMDDLLLRDRTNRKTIVADTPSAESQEAALLYKTIASEDGLSLVQITLLTGRTHQIRAQFSSRGTPLYGDVKYGARKEAENGIALFSRSISFKHPQTGEEMTVSAPYPTGGIWDKYNKWKDEV